MNATVDDVLAAQQACREAIETGEADACQAAWQAYDELARTLSTRGVPFSALRQVLDGHFELERQARRARDQLVESQQTVTRQRSADRAYRAHD
ncbi:MAG: hypothetical protein VX549_12070 [Pseudomonadota bacterium]|nr:hypothetical protein [Pseudomonadota bacterium]